MAGPRVSRSLVRGMTFEEGRADTTIVRRTAVIAALVLCSLLVVAAALAGPPRVEQKRLRPADMALAKRVVLRSSDLPSGWTRGQASPQPEQLPSCPGADLDFSAFTITGQARSAFAKGQ